MTDKTEPTLQDRLRGIYRIPITDGLGPAGGEEPDNPNEFVRTFPTTPIQIEAADALLDAHARIEELEAEKIAIAQKFDEFHPDPALMARIILKSISNEVELDARDALIADLVDALEWYESQRLSAENRAGAIFAPEDAEVRSLCERVGYGAVMDSASRQWAMKQKSGAFYIGGCIGDTTARAALAKAKASSD